MEVKKILSRCVIIPIVFVFMVMFLISLTYAADDQESINFGNVTLGSSVTKSLSITNTDNQKVLQLYLNFKEKSCDFSLASNLLQIEPGKTNSIEIYYNPSSIGTCSDLLLILYDLLPWKEIIVTGTGIETLRLTGKTGLIDTFDHYVKIGALKGLGSGKSADSRLKAFRKILESADDHIEAGKTEGACGQLKAAYNRLDSFVTGDEVLKLGQMIQQVITDLGCE